MTDCEMGRAGRAAVMALAMGVGAAGAVAGLSRHDRDLAYHEALAMEPQFQAAGKVNFGGRGMGSGTLIAPGWVLTAAHGTELTTGDRVRFTIGGQVFRGVEKFEHALWKGTARISEGYDLALVRLETTVEGIVPANLYRGPSIIGRDAMLVGAGLTGDGRAGQQNGTYGTLRAGLNTIDTTADQLASMIPGTVLSSNGLVVDFNDPRNDVLNRTGSGTPLDREFFAGGGDSGSGYWVQDAGGEWQVASVQSWGTVNGVGANFGQYGNMSISSKIYEPEVLAWIDGVISVPAPGGLGVLAGCGLLAVRRRR